MKTASLICRFVRLGFLPAVAIALAGANVLSAQNVDITNWNPAASVIRSEDVRIRHVLEGFAPAGFFDPGRPETIGLIKSENAVYVRFENNSGTIIPDGAVAVTAAYAQADPGLAAADLAGEAAAVPAAGWRTIGSYTMDLEILPGDPPGYGLLPGDTYPTSREDDEFPGRYRISCTVDCSQPLPTSFFLRVTLTLAGDTDTSTNVAYGYYDLTGGAPRADVVILHDVSGSMIGQLPFAQQRAKMFVDLMNPGDRVGVVAFSTQFSGNSSTAAALGALTTIDPSDPAKTLAKIGIDSFVAGGATPMGSGVLRAQQVLNAAPPPYPANRAIVMLTDGMENVEPRLQNPPAYPILNGLDTDANGGIAFFPLWFGTMSHWGKSLLEDVTTQVDRGKLVDQPSDDLKLAEAYLMIRGILTSDDVYAIHRGSSEDGYEAAIDVDEVTDELILTVAWHTFEQRELAVLVQPPGGSWQAAGSLAASTSRDQLYAVHRFPHPQAGVWRYRLAPSHQGEPYVLAALADKVEILMQSDLADNSVAAGEPLVLNARLTRRGKAVPGAVVRARIEAPDRSLGTILHDFRGRLATPLPPDPAAETPRAAGIVDELRQLTGNDAIFTYTPGTIDLTDADGDGVYTGRFENTRIAGTYNISITAESAETASAGFRREHRHAAVVALGRLDAERSIVSVDLLERTDPRGSTLRAVTVTPVDVFGNFIDPGYGARLQVDSTAGRWTGSLVDNQDGSYTRVLQLAPGETADVRVTAFGQELPPRSTTGGGGAGGRREISFHAGVVQPLGSLDDLLDRGSSLTLDLGYRFRSRLTALVLLGLHDFPREDGGSEKVWQISAGLRQRLSSRPLSLYVQGGPGLYRLFGDWEGGANLGIGLTYSASSAVDLEWGADFYDVFRSGGDARFWQLHIGSSIDF